MVYPNCTSIVKPNELLVQDKTTSLNPIDCCRRSMNKGWFTFVDIIIDGDSAGIFVKADSKSNYNESDSV